MIDFGFSLKTLQASRFYLLRITVHKFKPDRVACYLVGQDEEVVFSFYVLHV